MRYTVERSQPIFLANQLTLRSWRSSSAFINGPINIIALSLTHAPHLIPLWIWQDTNKGVGICSFAHSTFKASHAQSPEQTNTANPRPICRCLPPPSCSERHEQTKHTQDMDAAFALSSEIYKIASFECEDNAQVTSL